MVRDLMTRLDDIGHTRRIGLDRVPRDEPSALDLMLAEQLKNAVGPNHAEIAARDRGRRGQLARDGGRRVVMVEAQAHEMLGHGWRPSRLAGCFKGLKTGCRRKSA